jgi:hypothetical protein
MSLRNDIKDHAQALSRRLGIDQAAMEKILTYWTIRYPGQERQDGLQSLTLALLETLPGTPGLAFAVCRGRNVDWWRAYSYRNHYSLDWAPNYDDSTGETIAEMIGGVVQFERQIDGLIDGQHLWDKLPGRIQEIIRARLLGKRIKGADRTYLHRFAKENGQLLLA